MSVGVCEFYGFLFNVRYRVIVVVVCELLSGSAY